VRVQYCTRPKVSQSLPGYELVGPQHVLRREHEKGGAGGDGGPDVGVDTVTHPAG
jgi:hypothetical protein